MLREVRTLSRSELAVVLCLWFVATGAVAGAVQRLPSGNLQTMVYTASPLFGVVAAALLTMAMGLVFPNLQLAL